MANAEEDGKEQAPSSSKKKVLVFATVGLVLVGVFVGLTMFFMGGKGDGEEQVANEEGEEVHAEPKQAFYSSLAPAFIVNFQGKDSKARFLKVELDVITREEASLEAIKTHTPKIRNNLVLLFSRQFYEDLISHEGKERLRAEALTEVQKVLENETGKKAVEDVFFTSFVMQ